MEVASDYCEVWSATRRRSGGQRRRREFVIFETDFLILTFIALCPSSVASFNNPLNLLAVPPSLIFLHRHMRIASHRQ